jgi:hypothetical protein
MDKLTSTSATTERSGRNHEKSKLSLSTDSPKIPHRVAELIQQHIAKLILVISARFALVGHPGAVVVHVMAGDRAQARVHVVHGLWKVQCQRPRSSAIAARTMRARAESSHLVLLGAKLTAAVPPVFGESREQSECRGDARGHNNFVPK